MGYGIPKWDIALETCVKNCPSAPYASFSNRCPSHHHSCHTHTLHQCKHMSMSYRLNTTAKNKQSTVVSQTAVTSLFIGPNLFVSCSRSPGIVPLNPRALVIYYRPHSSLFILIHLENVFKIKTLDQFPKKINSGLAVLRQQIHAVRCHI